MSAISKDNLEAGKTEVQEVLTQFEDAIEKLNARIQEQGVLKQQLHEDLK
jgi:hypothetical protein